MGDKQREEIKSQLYTVQHKLDLHDAQTIKDMLYSRHIKLTMDLSEIRRCIVLSSENAVDRNLHEILEKFLAGMVGRFIFNPNDVDDVPVIAKKVAQCLVLQSGERNEISGAEWYVLLPKNARNYTGESIIQFHRRCGNSAIPILAMFFRQNLWCSVTLNSVFVDESGVMFYYQYLTNLEEQIHAKIETNVCFYM